MKNGILKELEERFSSLSLVDEKNIYEQTINEICLIAEHLTPFEQTEKSKEFASQYKVTIAPKIEVDTLISLLLQTIRKKFPDNLPLSLNEKDIRQHFDIQMQNILILEKHINIIYFFVYQCIDDAENCHPVQRLKIILLRQIINVYSKLVELLIDNQIPVVKEHSHNKFVEEKCIYYKGLIETILPGCYDFILNQIYDKSNSYGNLEFKNELWLGYKEIFAFQIMSLHFHLAFFYDEEVSKRLNLQIKQLYTFVILNKECFSAFLNMQDFNNEIELLKSSYTKALLMKPNDISCASFSFYQLLKRLTCEFKITSEMIEEENQDLKEKENSKKEKHKEFKENIDLNQILDTVKRVNKLVFQLKRLKIKPANHRVILQNIDSITQLLLVLIKLSNDIYLRITIPFVKSIFQAIDSYFLALSDCTAVRLINEEINGLKRTAAELSQRDIFYSFELIYQDLLSYEIGSLNKASKVEPLNEIDKSRVTRCLSYFGEEQISLFISLFIVYMEMVELKMPFEQKDASELKALERSQKYVFLEGNVNAMYFVLNHIISKECCDTQANRLRLLNKMWHSTMNALIQLYNSYYDNAFMLGETQQYISKIYFFYHLLDEVYNDYCPLMQQRLQESNFSDLDCNVLTTFSAFVIYKLNFLTFLQSFCEELPLQSVLINSAKQNLNFLKKNQELIVKIDTSFTDTIKDLIKKNNSYIRELIKSKRVIVPELRFYEFLKRYIDDLLKKINSFKTNTIKSGAVEMKKHMIILNNISEVTNNAFNKIKRIPSGKSFSSEQFKRIQDCLMSTSSQLEKLNQCYPNQQASKILPNITILLDGVEKLFMPVAGHSVHYKLIIEILNNSVKEILLDQINLYSEQTIQSLVSLPEKVVKTPKEIPKCPPVKKVKTYLPEPEMADIPLAKSTLPPLPKVECPIPKYNKRHRQCDLDPHQRVKPKFEVIQQKKREAKKIKKNQRIKEALDKENTLRKQTEENLRKRDLYEFKQKAKYRKKVEKATKTLEQKQREISEWQLSNHEKKIKYIAKLKVLQEILESVQSENRLLEDELLLQLQVKKIYDADREKIRELDTLELLVSDHEAETQALEKPYKTGYFCEFPKIQEWIEEGVEQTIKSLQEKIRKLGFFLYPKGGMILDGLLTKYLDIPILAHDADCISNVPLEIFLKLAPTSVWVMSHMDFELYRIGTFIQVVIVKPSISSSLFLSKVPGLYSEIWQNSYFLNHHGEVLALPGAIEHIFNPYLVLTRDAATLFSQDVSRIWRLFHLSTKTKKIICDKDMESIKLYASGLRIIPFGVYLSRLSTLFLRGRAQLNIELLLKEQFLLYLLPEISYNMNYSLDKSLIDFWIENFQIIDNCDPLERQKCYSVCDPITLLLLIFIFKDLPKLVEPSSERFSEVINWYYESYPIPYRHWNSLKEELLLKLSKYAVRFYAKESNKLFTICQSFMPGFDNYQNRSDQEMEEGFRPYVENNKSRNSF